MEIKKGIGVSPGVVISTAVVLDAEDLLIPKRTVAASDVGSELERLAQGIANAVVEITALRNEVTAKHGKEIGAIFDFHLGILKDKSLIKKVHEEVTQRLSSAEYAISVVMRGYANMFLGMANQMFADGLQLADTLL